MNLKMFNRLPHEINRLVGSFLDYDSRINFSRVLSDKDDKFVRKLDSDSHNRRTKIELLHNAVTRVCDATTLRKRAIQMTRLFRYMALTKDTCILDLHHSEFRRIVLDKAREHSNLNYGSISLLHPKVAKALVNSATLLINRWLTHRSKKLFNTAGKFVQII